MGTIEHVMHTPVRILRIHPQAHIPEYKTPGACGFDIACIEDATIAPGAVARLRTGLVICVPEGHMLMLAGRSSLPKKGLSVPHGFGTIDQDYCGPTDELLVQVLNFTQEPVEVKAGDRLAQGIFVPIARVSFTEAETLEGSNRGGFGSTG